MRTLLLVSLLLMTACTGNDPSGLSYRESGFGRPADEDFNRGCHGAFARGSDIDEYHDEATKALC